LNAIAVVDRLKVHISIPPPGIKLITDAPSLLQDALAYALAELLEIEQVSITMGQCKLGDSSHSQFSEKKTAAKFKGIGLPAFLSCSE
jgi:hypothetical protein